MNKLPKIDRTRLKKGRFCLQITTAQIGLTTQERQNQVENKRKHQLMR